MYAAMRTRQTLGARENLLEVVGFNMRWKDMSE